jgi:hypothetical protein
MSGNPVPNEVIGIPAAGPHYLHPSILRMGNILDIPEANFRLYVKGEGRRGGVVLYHVWNGNVILQQEFDPGSGLNLYNFYPQYLGGLQTIIELVQ